MIASKKWGECNCGCGQQIREGTKFVIIDGAFFIDDPEHTGKYAKTEPCKERDRQYRKDFKQWLNETESKCITIGMTEQLSLAL